MTRLLLSLVFPVVLATSSLALAEEAPAPGGGEPNAFQKVREACHEDVTRLCQDVKPGEGRIRECLRAHRDDLSEGCKVAIRDARAHHHPRPDQN